jgi:serine/threonine-protein kinase
MGEVWRAEHIALRSPVAIKLLPRGVASDETRASRFMREAQAAAAIRSTNVVHVIDHGVEDGVPFIAMEYLEGESLDDRLDRRGRLSPVETLRILMQVAKAVGRAHSRGIVHRDLKPANIFLVDEDEREIVKVLDFGIAKLTVKQVRPEATTQAGAMLGTPYYMSPEQARGHREVDHRSDLWALGIIAFECLTGERPMDGATVGDLVYKICGTDMPKPSSVAPVPIRFDAWFAKAARRDPDERFQSAKDLALALREALLDEAPASPPPESIPSFDRLESEERDRSSLELLDTLVARRMSEPPGSAGRGPASDSWDTSGDHHIVPLTPPAPPGDTPSSPARPRDAAGESLRGALSRTAAPPVRSTRGRWLIGGAVAAVAAVALFVSMGDDAPEPKTHRPAAEPASGTLAPPTGAASEPSTAAALPSTPPSVAASDATPEPSASAASSSRARSSPRRSPPQPSANRTRIDFGI